MDQIDSGGGEGGGGMGQNKNRGIFGNTQTYVFMAIIAIAAIIYFSTRTDQNQNQTQNSENQNADQQSESNNGEQQPAENQASEGQDNQTGQNNPNEAGNVSAVGILKNSDNQTRGNLMLESQSGKIYIATRRDFTPQLDKEVTLQAQGTLNQFVFLGLSEGSVDTTARGGVEEEPLSGNVSFSGTMQNSDDSTRGNYTLVSGNTKVYLQTVRDYSSLVGSEVNLTATGTLNSFTNGLVTKK